MGLPLGAVLPFAAYNTGIDTANAHIDLARDISFHGHGLITDQTVVVGAHLIIVI